MTTGFENIGVNFDSTNCEVCIKSKQTRAPVSKTQVPRPDTPLFCVCSDLFGPVKVTALTGERFAAIFVDHYSNYGRVHFLKNKSDTLVEFKKAKSIMENEKQAKIGIFHSDNGGEFSSKDFVDFLEFNGIKTEYSAPYTPQHNGIAERRVRSLKQLARSMMIASSAPPSWWKFAVALANHIYNRVAPSGTISPYEKFFGVRPDLSKIRVFGCRAWVKIENPESTWSPRSTCCAYLGPNEKGEGFILYNYETKKIFTSRNV